jgi:uncharacterized protein YceH (UPF0502 family)
LRSRTNRLCDFADAAQVESTLKGLMEREDGPFIARLPRAPGSRESRYAHLFSGLIESAPESPDPVDVVAAGTGQTVGQRLAALEEKVAALQLQIEALADGGSLARTPPH